jgi:porphobilinogen synthase
MSEYPERRMRRLRQNGAVRRLFDGELPGPGRLLWPVFVAEGSGVRQPIESLPGQFRYSPDRLGEALTPLAERGIGGVLIFGVTPTARKDEAGAAACDPQGVVAQAVRLARRRLPEWPIFTDVCLCGATTHGHCGPLDRAGGVDNDAAVATLGRVAVMHAEAGATGVAPSAMMDGQVRGIRAALDGAGLHQTIVMSYSTKFASHFYGPFRQAAGSTPLQGDRRGYQASFADPRRALLESALDEAEGADILMVKPALCYLDILARLRDRTDLPIAAYNVSGEYAMITAACERGWGEWRGMVRESLTAIARAGADILISHWADRYDEWAKGEEKGKF